MEKNQQSKPGAASSAKGTTDELRPGQQLPPENTSNLDQPQGENDNMKQHSASSLPERDEETLGTP